MILSDTATAADRCWLEDRKAGMIEWPECQCDIRSLNNFSGAMLEWYKGKRRGMGTMQGGTVPCLALLAVTSIYHNNAATLIWANQNTTKRIKTWSKNTTKRIKTTESVDVYGSKIWNHRPCDRGQELRTTILFWARGDELRITQSSFLGELPWVKNYPP
jgi:hypothetical protein